MARNNCANFNTNECKYFEKGTCHGCAHDEQPVPYCDHDYKQVPGSPGKFRCTKCLQERVPPK
jgi:hypothetical protein